MSDDTKIVQYAEVLLVHLGYDTDSPLFKDTALRFANRIRPFAANEEMPEGSILGASVEEDEDLAQVPVTISPIEFDSMCARHFMPIFGAVGVLYIPTAKQPSIRAVSHVVEYHTKQFIDQQTATRKIGRELAIGMDPQAVYVVVSARHTCEGNAIVTTEWGARIAIEISRSLVERVEKSLK